MKTSIFNENAGKYRLKHTTYKLILASMLLTLNIHWNSACENNDQGYFFSLFFSASRAEIDSSDNNNGPKCWNSSSICSATKV